MITETGMVTLRLSLMQKFYDVIETARKFIPDPATIQWERREIELAERMQALDLELEK